MKRIVLMQVVTALILAAAITAAVPQMINYQGRLTDPSGVPLDTTVSITFTIYDDSAAGSVIWTETQSSVTTTDGLFSVLLGSVNPISDTVFSDTVRYLGIKVGSDLELSPRRRIASVAYAHRSSQISTVDGAAGGGDLLEPIGSTAVEEVELDVVATKQLERGLDVSPYFVGARCGALRGTAE